MGGGLGTSTGTANTSGFQNTQTNPWAPTIGTLSQNSPGQNVTNAPWAQNLPGYNLSNFTMPSMVGHAGDIYNQLLGPSPSQSAAADQALNVASKLPNFGKPVANVAQGLLTGNQIQGTPINPYGAATGNLAQLQNTLQKYTTPDYLNPLQSQAMQPFLQQEMKDVQDSIRGTFASAGRDLSPAESSYLQKGTLQALLPQYNQNVQQQQAAANSLFQGGNITNQAIMQQLGAGAGLAAAQPQIAMAPSQAYMNAANAATFIPAQNMAVAESLMLPLAGLGGQTNSQFGSNTNTSQTGSPLSQLQGIASLFQPLGQLGTAFGGGLGGGSSGGGSGLFG